MSFRIIRSAHCTMHRAVVVVATIACAVRAYRVIVVMPIAVVPIYMWCYAIVRVPPSRPISPVVWRVPTCPGGSPEPVIDIRAVDVHRLDDIVCAIDVLVTYNLNRDRLCLLVFLDIDRCHILVDVFSEYSLYHYQVMVSVGCFYHT